MSILAYITLNDTAVKQRGDIFQVRLIGAPIARRSRREFAFLVIDDAALETRLLAMKVALEARVGGEHWPNISYPYATWDSENRLVKTSTRNVNLDALDPTVRQQVDDPDTESPILARGSVTVRTR